MTLARHIQTLPAFQLEAYVNRYAARARHHLSASDADSMTVSELLALGDNDARIGLSSLNLGYSDTAGSLALRTQIAATYDTQRAENIVCFAGAGEAIFAVCATLFLPSDHVIVVTPNYQSHETLPAALCDVTAVALVADADWALDLNIVADAVQPNTKAVFINYPHNPTGTVLPPQALQDLVEICRANGLFLINDEVFRGLPAPRIVEPPAVADIYEKGISINVLSKSYGLPGLRIGWVATADHGLLAKLEATKHYLSVCVATTSEFLATVALKNREKILARNRDLIARNKALWDAFFSRHQNTIEAAFPQGGTIAYPRYLGPKSVDAFADELRERHGVFVIPASIFASAHGTTPTDRFRIGFARRGLAEGLAAFDDALSAMRI